MTRKRESIMLAHPAEPKRIASLGETFFVQPKLNGVRLHTRESSTGPILLSSTDREFPFLPYIREQLLHLPPHSWDGELYIHGKSWADINSIASRTVNNVDERLDYYIFDHKNESIPFKQRMERLQYIQKLIQEFRLPNIKVVPTFPANQQNWPSFLSIFEKEKYEGIIFRSLWGPYEPKRSKHLLKLKPTCTDLYQIIGAVQGKGWCYDRLGAFVVQDKRGNQFEIGSGACLTADNRLTFWQMYLSGELTKHHILVKHEKIKTANGFPACAVGLEVISPGDMGRFEGHEDA